MRSASRCFVHKCSARFSGRTLARGELGGELERLSQREFRAPDSSRTRSDSVPTQRRWHQRFCKDRLAALAPVSRALRSALGPAAACPPSPPGLTRTASPSENGPIGCHARDGDVRLHASDCMLEGTYDSLDHTTQASLVFETYPSHPSLQSRGPKPGDCATVMTDDRGLASLRSSFSF